MAWTLDSGPASALGDLTYGPNNSNSPCNNKFEDFSLQPPSTLKQMRSKGQLN